MTAVDEKLKEARRKQKLCKKIGKESNAKKENITELCEQIEVCEYLSKPISDAMIVELLFLPYRQMCNWIFKYKMA